MFDLSGRVALVSGAASGMGKATAVAVAEAGADVVLADINEDGVQATAGEIESLNRRALPLVCDISEPEQICSLFARVDDEFGRIDFLANIAGETVRQETRRDFSGRSRVDMAQFGLRTFLLLPASGAPYVGRRERKYRQPRFAGERHSARPRSHRVQHGDGSCGPNDARVEHRMERTRRARQFDPARPGSQPRSASQDRHRSAHQRSFSRWDTRRPIRRAGRHQRARCVSGFRCLVLGHRRADSDGRWQPGDECRRLRRKRSVRTVAAQNTRTVQGKAQVPDFASADASCLRG